MNLLHYILFITVFPGHWTVLIQPKKACADCKYFVGNTKKCSLYSEFDIVSGTQNYEDALDVRKDSKKCGEQAKHFEKNNWKFITVPAYFMIENSYLAFPLSLYLFGVIYIVWNHK